MDESTPHLHLVFVPVVHTKDKNGKEIEKIACSEYWKGKDSYRQLQDSFYKYITDNRFELERGKANHTEHLNIETLKQITGYDNIKYELANEEIQSIENKNTALILAQNQQLVEYTNKLKEQLSKSYNTITKIEELKKENINLRNENRELKAENYKLRNYIEKTFEVVKNLFSFPIDRLKHLVDNFIRDFEKY